MMLHKDPSQNSGFQTIVSHRPAGPPLVLSGKTELGFWYGLLLSDSPSWNPLVDVTTSTIFPHWHHLCRKKSGTDPLHISEALEVTMVTATKPASSSVTHWQLPCEGLTVRGMKVYGAGCLGKEPRLHIPGRCQSVRAPGCHGVVHIHVESSPGEGG